MGGIYANSVFDVGYVCNGIAGKYYLFKLVILTTATSALVQIDIDSVNSTRGVIKRLMVSIK